MMTMISSCSSSDNEEPQKSVDIEVNEIWHSISGSYKGSFYIMNTDNLWYTETITFHPYSEPKEITPLFDSKCMAYGVADISDTRFLDISDVSHSYYSIKVKYSGAVPTITFYEYGDGGDIINKGDERNIRVSGSDIFLWSYGLTEKENAIRYIKQ